MAQSVLFANNANSTLAGAISNTAVVANLAPGSGALFPAPGDGQYFVMTFTDVATGLLNEIIHVTNVTADTITMIRAQEGTTALNWNAGDLAANLLTAGTLNTLFAIGNLFSGDAPSAGLAAAQTVSCTPTLQVLGSGQLVTFEAGFDCPGAMTLKVDGTVAVSVKTWVNGSLVDPQKADFKAGQQVIVVEDGAEWILSSRINFPPTGKQTIPILAFSMQSRGLNPPATNLTGTVTNNVMEPTLDFLNGVQEFAQFIISMPKAWDPTQPVTARFRWLNDAGGGSVVWAIQAMAIRGGSNIDTAFGTPQEVTQATAGTGTLNDTAATGTIVIANSPQAGDLVFFQVYRDGTNGADTLPDPARLLDVDLYINVLQGNDN